MSSLSRRVALKIAGTGAALIGLEQTAASAAKDASAPSKNRVDHWNQTHDRVWLGQAFWANPMEDWAVVDGAAECTGGGGDRSIHCITKQLVDATKSFEMSAGIKQVEVKGADGGAGFRVGTRSEIDEYRSNCFARNGITAGLIDGKLQLGRTTAATDKPVDPKDFHLTLTGKPTDDQYRLTLTAKNGAGETQGEITATFPKAAVLGNVSVVNNYQPKVARGRGARYRFSDWNISGDAFNHKPEQEFGPLLWSMYTLSDSRSDEGFVLKLSALTGPLGEKDNHSITLMIEKEGEWVEAGKAALDTDAWVATFRLPNWNEKADTPYRLVYVEHHSDGSKSTHDWTGNIKANPVGRSLRLGALTCQNDYAFPYEPVANNVVKLDPDMLYFSGDQLYENHGGYGIIRDPAPPAILNYLRKFYQFGWSFREALRNAPTVCLPDDHDVFQGNIWGEGGAKMKNLAGGASSKGGYREPARMVNVVHRTCTSHHPDPFDAKPCKQDISVYFGDLVYGNVSFAILGDRQWKSGPERVETGSGRADHVMDPDFDTSKLDAPGLVLLGERQEAFLEEWSKDWRGHTMKVLLSQTVLAGVATHHGGYNGYLKADLDCGGWPQTARDRAIDIIRESMALHINGDQHLTTLVQYGVKEQRDSNWSFCTPAIAVGYPRWWRPDEVKMPHANRPKHGLPNTGEFTDGLGNAAYVYAVGNPLVGRARNRYDKAHEKGSGFGMVTIDTDAKTYHLESFRFLVDPTDGKADNQFPGWPVTIHQAENKGENRLG